MKIQEVYKTEDGKVFYSKYEAEEYVKSVLGRGEVNFKAFLNSYSGSRLIKQYDLNTYGIWKIYGEDPNCDLGGYHHMPYLDTVECTLERAIRHAVTLDKWFTWGAGGKIEKVEINKL